jgi:hypothetical protein
MKLYITDGSAYARMARVVVSEKDSRLASRSSTSRRGSLTVPTTASIHRVGSLTWSAMTAWGFEVSALICTHLGHVAGNPTLGIPPQADRWEALRLEALARSVLDGLSVWLRESARPRNEQSPSVMQHEAPVPLAWSTFGGGRSTIP